MMLGIRAIIGPPGCGKTRNAETLRKLYRARRIVEQDSIEACDPERLVDGDLILTTTHLFPRRKTKWPEIKYINWDDVLAEHKDKLELP